MIARTEVLAPPCGAKRISVQPAPGGVEPKCELPLSPCAPAQGYDSEPAALNPQDGAVDEAAVCNSLPAVPDCPYLGNGQKGSQSGVTA